MVSLKDAIKELEEQGYQVRHRCLGRPVPVESSALEELAKVMHDDAMGVEQGFERPPKEIRIVRTDNIADREDALGEDEYLVLWKKEQSVGHNEGLWKRTKPTLQSDFLMRQHFPEWLGDVKGKTILDACCGEGYVARMLASRGAKVYGFDNNPEMIYLARQMEKDHPLGIDYKVADVRNLGNDKSRFVKGHGPLQMDRVLPASPYDRNVFDIAIFSGMPPFFSAYQLDEIHKSISTRLKPDGVLLVTSLHTDAYFQGAKSGWMAFHGGPFSAGDWRVREVLTNPGSPSFEDSLDFYAPNGELAFSGHCYFHTPLRIKSSMERARFEVIREYAPLVTEEDIKYHPERWKDEVRVPFHLALLGRKMPPNH